MKPRVLFLLAAFGTMAYPQAWSTFLDPSRAIDWTSAGFTIPSYSVNCATQPTLTANSTSAASANSTAIQNALNSCDATHNVVHIPAGTYYISGIQFGYQGFQVLRGAGPTQTTLTPTAENNCGGLGAGICMMDQNPVYNQSSQILGAGSQQCTWSGTNGTSGAYTQGATTINLTNCGGAPPLHQILMMDQANDASDTGGVYVCGSTATNCVYDGSGSTEGRTVSGAVHGQLQATYITAVTSLGSGAYTVTISPGVYFNNIRSSQNPGVWWSGMIQNTGVENMTVDSSHKSGSSYQNGDYSIGMYDCYQCWVRNVRVLYSGRASAIFYQSAKDVIRDSYFYQAQGHQQVSYNIESQLSSAFLIENNIFQQVTTPLTYNTATGAVADYNFAVADTAFSGYTWPAFSSHNNGNDMNLFEGNNFPGIEADDAWGSSVNQTIYRNVLNGWEAGASNENTPIILRSFVRGYNIVGNVMGQPGIQTTYQTYATSATAGTSAGTEDSAIYSIGWSFDGSCGTGKNNSSPSCDPLSFSTLMRWGNWDTVSGAARWNATEASPAAVPYLNANFSSSYFSSLAQTLPNSIYYGSQPSWWPSGKVWPLVGPDVSSGNIGICTGGTYAGAQATSSSQCTGGSLSSAYAGHANSTPAQDCYLNTMSGPPDGSGSALAFDASACYASSGAGSGSGSGPAAPTGLTVTVQ